MSQPPLDTSGGFGPVQTVPARAGITRQVFDVFRDRFGIEATPQEAVTVLRKEINPVVDVEWLAPFGDSRVDEDINLTATIGTYVPVFTVPVTEKWKLQWVSRGGTTIGTPVIVLINTLEVLLTAPGTAFEGFACEVLLEPLDSIGMRTTGDAGDDARDLWIAFTRYLVR